MDDLDDVIREAIKQLPAAFETHSAIPPSYGPERLSDYSPLDNDTTLSLGAEAELRDEATADDEREQVIADFERATSEAGFEAIAFYISFHNRTEDGMWGIFYYDDAIRALAAKIRRDLGITDGKKCYRLAKEIVRKHELFHFRFDLFAMQQELTLKRPLYNKYQRNAYRKVLFTDECYEESLANASSVSGWSLLDRLSDTLSTRSFLSIEDLLAFDDSVQAAAVTSRLHGPTPMDSFVREMCKRQPPGYRDFDRDLTDLRAGLGGQLLYSSVGKKLPNPQAEWVGRAAAFADRKHCPEYLIPSKGDVPQGAHRFTKSIGGQTWRFHRYDADTWPSKPHGHNLETGEKLDLAGGWIYDRNRNPRRRCKKVHLEELRADAAKMWPEVPLPPLVWAAKSS